MKNLIRFDWAMKKLLRSKANFGILEGFLSELLKRDLKICELLESESNKNHFADKQNRVDILAKLDSGELVLIEVQANNEDDFFQRMIYGTSKIVTEHIEEGAPYQYIKKIFSVNILYFDLGHGEDYIYHGTTRFIGLHQKDELNLSAKQQELYRKEHPHELYPEYYLIKVNQFNDLAKDTLDEWIYFLKHEEIKDHFRAKGLSEAKTKMVELKLSPAERQNYAIYLDNLRYQSSMFHTNYDSGLLDGKKIGFKDGEKFGMAIGIEKGEKLGIEKGEKLGIEKGEKLGIEKGEKLGMAKGEKLAALKIARNMQEAGLAPNLIATATGLTAAEIEKLIA